MIGEVRKAFETVFGERCPRGLLESTTPDGRVGYVSEYTTEGVMQMCHAAIDGDVASLDKMAGEMAELVSPGDTLVPLPGKDGDTRASRALANRIAVLSGASVDDALEGTSGESGPELGLSRPVDGNPVVVDFCEMSGMTMKAALDLIPGSRGIAYAVDQSKYSGDSALVEGLSPDDLKMRKLLNTASPDSDLWHGNLEYFDSPETRFDTWLVHNSDWAQEIYEGGFNTGTTEKELAYSDRTTENPGPYGFAFTLDNVPEPLGEFRRGMIGLPYCDDPDIGGSIVFVASGNHVRHVGDNDNEFIFDWREPAGCFWVRNRRYDAWKDRDKYGDEEEAFVDDFSVMGRDADRPLFRGTYMKCIDWLRRNAETYAGQMKMWRSVHGRPTAAVSAGKPLEESAHTVRAQEVARFSNKAVEAIRKWISDARMLMERGATAGTTNRPVFIPCMGLFTISLVFDRKENNPTGGQFIPGRMIIDLNIDRIVYSRRYMYTRAPSDFTKDKVKKIGKLEDDLHAYGRTKAITPVMLDGLEAMLDTYTFRNVLDHEITHFVQELHREYQDQDGELAKYGIGSADYDLGKHHELLPWEIDADVHGHIRELAKMSSSMTATEMAMAIYRRYAGSCRKKNGFLPDSIRRQCWDTAVSLSRAIKLAAERDDVDEDDIDSIIRHLDDYAV